MKKYFSFIITLLLIINTDIFSSDAVSCGSSDIHVFDPIGNKAVTSFDNESPMIALTFDDGPSDRATDEILDVLEKYNARATFFVLGSNVEKYEDKLERAVRLKCEIGNHTYDHKKLSKLTEKEIEYQIKSTEDSIFKACGIVPELIRPPYGIHNSKTMKICNSPVILWSVDTLDWKNRDPYAIVDTVLSKASAGDIILMHDIYPTTAEACRTIIPKLISMGFQLVTVSELMSARGYTVVSGQAVVSVR